MNEEKMDKDLNALRSLLFSKESNYSVFNLTEKAIASFHGDVFAIKEIIEMIVSAPFSLRDYFYLRKFCLFYEGIDILDLDQKTKLSDKLFNNSEKGKENILKIITYIDKTEEEKNILYIINATRSFIMNDELDEDLYFRIIKAISNSLHVDLDFLKKKIPSYKVEGNTNTTSLVNSGLMIQNGISLEKTAEKQNFTFTSLGIAVDKYALSIDDEKRMKFYENQIYVKKTKIPYEEIDYDYPIEII